MVFVLAVTPPATPEPDAEMQPVGAEATAGIRWLTYSGDEDRDAVLGQQGLESSISRGRSALSGRTTISMGPSLSRADWRTRSTRSRFTSSPGANSKKPCDSREVSSPSIATFQPQRTRSHPSIAGPRRAAVGRESASRSVPVRAREPHEDQVTRTVGDRTGPGGTDRDTASGLLMPRSSVRVRPQAPGLPSTNARGRPTALARRLGYPLRQKVARERSGRIRSWGG